MDAVTALRRVPSWVLPLCLAVVALLLPTLGMGFDSQRQVLLICMLTLLVSGLNLSLGYAGELALGQAAVYAAGAYVSGYLGTHGHTDIVMQLVLSGLAGLVVGVVTGIPGLRLGSWSLAMTSFFMVLLIPNVLEALQGQTGGVLGLSGIMPATIFGGTLSQHGFYLVCVLVTGLWLLVMRNLVTSRHGTAFRVLRESPVLASSMGISVFRMKVKAYALGSLPAGLAGCLFANLDHYLAPGSFTFSLAIAILAASILGGSASVYGAVVGSAIMQLGPLESTSFQEYALVAYGTFLIIGGVLLGGGISGLLRRLVDRVVRRLPASAAAAGAATGAADLGSLPGAPLEIAGVSKAFGGIQALEGVSLTARAGQVTALIGPNGSGKTTLLNVVCGHYRADAGAIRLGDDDVLHRPAYRVARSGVARTFQTPSVPKDISVAEAVRAGRYSQHYSSLVAAVLRLPRYLRTRRADLDEAARVLALVGIDAHAEEEAAALPLGTRRLLEVARALITRPRVLLLDEAASGLDEDEVERLATLIRHIRDAGCTVVLVEHNFRLVLSLADEIYVLAEGSIIASGTPATIERHPEVLSKYLGVRDPQTSQLLESTIRQGAGPDDD